MANTSSNEEVGSVGERAGECLDLLESGTVRLHGSERRIAEEHLLRFNLWASNIGVFAGAHASLDYRLRDAPSVRSTVVSILDILRTNIQAALVADGPAGHISSDQRDGVPTKSTLQLAELLGRLKDGTTSSSSGPPKPLERSTTQLAKLEALTKPLDHLHRLSVAIRKASDRNPLSRAMKTKIIGHDGQDISDGFDDFVRRVIDARFSFATEKLRLRISDSISIRRRQFLYAKDHQVRLEYSTRKPTQRVVAPENLSVLSNKPSHPANVDDTSRPSAPTLPSTTASIFIPENYREPTPSQPSSTASSSSRIELVHIPPPPEVDRECKESKCPYCSLVLPQRDFLDSRKWRRHVEADLRPYMCIHDYCTLPDGAFGSRKEWLEHLRKPHFSAWVCPLHKGKRKAQHQDQDVDEYKDEEPIGWTFTSQADLEHHLLSAHKESLASFPLPLLIKQSAKHTRLPTVCPLCGLSPDSLSRPGLEFHLRRHVADHFLDQFQLSFPLPEASENPDNVSVSDASMAKNDSSHDEPEASHPGTGSMVDDFKSWWRRSKLYGTLDPFSEVDHAFLPYARVEEYFKDTAKIFTLLHEILPSDEADSILPLVIQRYRLAFCVLLIIGHGELINHFVAQHTLSDDKLPFLTQPFELPPTAENIFPSFAETQWMVCVPSFRLGMSLNCDRRCILPIVNKERLGASAGRRVHKVTLDAAYNELNPATEMSENTHTTSSESANVYVVKSYLATNQHATGEYEVEELALRRIVPPGTLKAGLVAFYGSFGHGSTHNILLEYAEHGNLADYFLDQFPPTDGDTISAFWNGMMALLLGLSQIHEIKNSEDTVLHGWHQDIKPQNILVKGHTYPFEFVITGFGRSHFKRPLSVESTPMDTDSCGTRTYGAPECYRADDASSNTRPQVPQSVDIWSLGCIYSEAAVWLVSGESGRNNYELARRKATEELQSFRDIGCFHNGSYVLECVQTQLESIVGKIRLTDAVTARVMRLVVSMLGSASERPAAKALWESFTGDNQPQAMEGEPGSSTQSELVTDDVTKQKAPKEHSSQFQSKEAASSGGGSNIRGGINRLLPPMFDAGDQVYYVPDPRKRRARQGPYKVVAAKDGPRGRDPVYSLKWNGKGPGKDMPNVSEIYLMY